MNQPVIRVARSLASALLLLAFVVAGPSAAATLNEAHAKLYARVDSSRVRVAIEIEIEKGWHLYHDDLGNPDAVGKPTTVKLEAEGVEFGPARFPKPLKLEQEGLGTWIYGHEGKIVVYAGGTASGAAVGAVRAKLSGLTCEDLGSCVLYSESIEGVGTGSDELFASFPDDLFGDLALESIEEIVTDVAPTSSSANELGDAQDTVQELALDAPVVSTLPGTSTVQDGAASALVSKHVSGEAEAELFHRVSDSHVDVVIRIEIEKGWHLYHTDLGDPKATGLPTEVELVGTGVTWSEPRFPEPHRLEQPGLGSWINSHEGEILVYVRGTFAGSAPKDIGAKLSGLTCVDLGTCVPYNETLSSSGHGADELFAKFPRDWSASAAAGGAHPDQDGASGSTTKDPATRSGSTALGAITLPDFEPRTDSIERSLWWWLLIAFIAGMILNVMPCVLPVISIKILSFVRQAGEDRGRILSLGIAFAAGILVVFLVLAGLAVSLGLSWGEQFQSQQFLVVMIGIVFAFALSMFGVYELGVPQAIGAAASGPMREGLGDAFFKGMLATVLATPCSGPFLGSTLTWTLSQPPVTVFAIFTSLGLGMALPYVVLTANPGLLKLVPKPGPWMDTFKQAMGFVLLATAVYLMVSLRQDLLLFTAAFLVFVALGCWWWGRFATFDQSAGLRLLTLGFSLTIIAFGAQFSFRTLRGLFEPREGGIAWVEYDPETFTSDLGKRNVFVDFTADWCPNCKYNEAFVYETDEVVQRLAEKGVAVYKADITHDDETTREIERLMDELGARSIPFMAVFPHDDPTSPHIRFDIVKQSDMIAILDSLPAPRDDQVARPDVPGAAADANK